MTPGPFLLLDDRTAPIETAAARLFADPLEHLVCRDAREVDATFARIDAALAAGHHVALVAAYELGGLLQRVRLPAADVPLLEVLICPAPQRLHRAAVDAWLDADDAPASIVDMQPAWDAKRYGAAFDWLQQAIHDGDCYQGNITFPLTFGVMGSPAALYARLVRAQPTAFCAFGRLAERHVLSLSPELFVRRRGSVLTAKPMKGTAPRDQDPSSLPRDDKTRAENVMIVDLLRNDLGRLAEIGSVRVPELFAVEPLPTVWQMTSTVEATRHGPLPTRELFAALFPCGSVTGAPKRRAMEVLAEVEQAPRGTYCGAIGWMAPDGDFSFSVPIRTLELDAAGKRGRMGIGSGVVADSGLGQEYDECVLKSRFLTRLDPGFALIETLRVEDGQAQRLQAHIDRLDASAQALDFVFDRHAARAEVATRAAGCGHPHRLRMLLTRDGALTLEVFPLEAIREPVTVRIADASSDSADPFLRHKTTWRPQYDRALRQATRAGDFDHLFFNERDELAEGARSCVFVRIGHRWVTPPLSAGVLPSVMRAELLRDPDFGAVEGTVSRAQLLAARQVVVANSVRGALTARVAG
ncbi:MAG: aminodeoxychorismate synthase component I [Burkholderiales bacterium]|nr:aminodeoxychorismate synthase component I [Burkholderiales bacterium]